MSGRPHELELLLGICGRAKLRGRDDARSRSDKRIESFAPTARDSRRRVRTNSLCTVISLHPRNHPCGGALLVPVVIINSRG